MSGTTQAGVKWDSDISNGEAGQFSTDSVKELPPSLHPREFLSPSLLEPLALGAARWLEVCFQIRWPVAPHDR
jgi:hypothetical protein